MADDFSDLARRVEDLSDDLRETADDSVQESLEDTKEAARTELNVHDANWQHKVWLSLKVLERQIVDGKHKTTRHKFISDGSIAPHNRYLELGTGMHFGEGGYSLPSDVHPYKSPSFSPKLVRRITEWVETKPVEPRIYNSTKGLGRAIAWQISEEGTPAQPYFRPAWQYTKHDLYRSLKSDVRRELRRA